MPAMLPVTIPAEPIVAIPALPLLHAPPLRLSLRVVVKPEHTAAVPVITEGIGFTDIVFVITALPQLSDME